MRQYIRHPSDIPITFQLEDVVSSRKEYLNNISSGGLSFKSSTSIETGTRIHIRIPLIKPSFEAVGVVVWCTPNNDHFDVGVQFEDFQSSFKVRMVEQVCHIEHYKKKMEEIEGRMMSGEEAAMEWIERFAKNFPDNETEIEN